MPGGPLVFYLVKQVAGRTVHCDRRHGRGGKDQDGGGKGIRPDLEVEFEMPTWNRWSQNS